MKQFLGNSCVFMGFVSLAMVGVESDNFALFLIITTSSTCMFAFFMTLAAWLLSEEKETEIEMPKMCPLDEIKRPALQKQETRHLPLPMPMRISNNH